MKHTKRFLPVALLLALSGASVSAVVGWSLHERGPRTRAAWAFKARGLEELAGHADAIVLARAGASWLSRIAWSDNGEDTLPFELVELQVLRSLKGPLAGSTLHLERAGGTDLDGTQVEIDADGGALERGATYLFFLKRQEEGEAFYQVNDQARFQVRGAALAAVEEHDPVAGELHGLPLGQALTIVGQAIH